MGFINKIKNILFEEEEIEVPVKNTSKKIETKQTVKLEDDFRDLDDASERLEKAKQNAMEEPKEEDNSFKFPDFDEYEFENTKPKKEVEPPKPEVKETVYERRAVHTPIVEYRNEYREPVEKKTSIEIKPSKIEYRTYEKETRIIEKKKFRPSPNISPVYGILDKDYVPDEITLKEKDDDIKRKSPLDIETVRKKAFAPEEIEEKEIITEKKEEKIIINRPEQPKRSEEVLKKEKSLEELLEDSATEEIIIDDDVIVEDNIRDIEDELDKIDEDIILDNKPKEFDEDDTLEQDLFELIDSMYDDKKEIDI